MEQGFDMFLGLYASSDFDRKRHLYIEQHPPAWKTGAYECQRSGCCCWTRPPRLTQQDLARLAERFGMTPAEFFKAYCVVDDPAGSENCPVLARTHQLDNYVSHYLSSDETFSFESPCQFLDVENGNACKIHDVKPEECAGHRCWDKENETKVSVEWTREELLSLGWDGNEDYF
jgi:Fe-S-cluster containining protein